MFLFRGEVGQQEVKVRHYEFMSECLLSTYVDQKISIFETKLDKRLFFIKVMEF